jgi:predicted O-methyltransferase YrrM
LTSDEEQQMENPRNHGRRAAIRNSLRASLAAAAAMTLSATARAQGRRGAAMRAPLPNAADERRVLAVIQDVYRNHRYLSVPQEDGRLLRLLAESTGAGHVVELGTSTGYSGLWLLLALSRTGGRLTTFEADRGRHQVARSNFDRAGLLPLATLVLGDAHDEAAKLKDPIDLLFLDADKEGYLDYLRRLGPLVRAGGLIVAHNMASPPPDPRYVDAVTTDPALETVFLNMHDAGLGVTLKKR